MRLPSRTDGLGLPSPLDGLLRRRAGRLPAVVPPSPPSDDRPALTAPSMPLGPGAVWRGCQTSGAARYDVEIRVCAADGRAGELSGTLTIRNLTPGLPKLVTFFDGEIIGPRHSFVTDKWGATPEDDDRLWARFGRALPPSYPFAEPYVSEHERGQAGEHGAEQPFRASAPGTGTDLPAGKPTYLRLKERAILNAADAADISGASFSGFYYLALDLNPAASASAATSDPDADAEADACSSTSDDSSRAGTPLPTASAARHAGGAGFRRFSDGPSLVRRESYASIVQRGRSATIASSAAPAAPAAHGFAAPRAAPAPIPIKQDDAVSSGMEPVPWSPSYDEFPLPSPSVPPVGGHGFPLARSRSASQPRSTSTSGLPTLRTTGGGSDSAFGGPAHYDDAASAKARMPFFNPLTGYRGAFAHAEIRGFYFASSAPASASSGPGGADEQVCQELELHYCGDGLGVLREEAEDEQDRLARLRAADDAWYAADPLATECARRADDPRFFVRREFERREAYARPRGSASFTIL